ncbi:choice-of-anchor A family protein [Janthinobacterium agaricidamnosum]|uniref:PEP-CTERM putative exosortase interaction domain protein n=1 Tax=Janthinobacterium agaricidamnosum NBRC 102515 = DSM 9628 TaxID=1349767 RepID=W0VCJ3_9BURK|nr:choice-of-anchor A family protein [Janthinobacterium agaricidamnosum]CDG85012.1 PEP-CTERM putative exosortase interaction domain protein [Janthinobacterium agaricidamnosum NBRC 102515 = DSM 9628]
MSILPKASTILLLSAAFSAGAAQAAVVDLGIGGANFYTLGSFNSSNSSVGGALLVAGSMNASNYSINSQNKDAYGSSAYALVVGGSLNYQSGSINNGSYYVGGSSNISNTGFGGGAAQSGSAPLSFTETSAQLKNTALSLSKVAATGTATAAPGGLTLTGSGNGGVQVFDISGASLLSANNLSFNKLKANDTVIVNVSGSVSGFNNVGLNGLNKYNVLFNFYEASSLSLQGFGLDGSVLAPLASVNGGNGSINGNVVVGNWNSNIAIGGGNAFKASDVAGLVSPVPEPETYAMLLAGLGLLGFVARRKAAKGKLLAA